MTEEGDNQLLKYRETHVQEQRISQHGGRAGDLVMSIRAQHDCGAMNDGKTGLWACFAVPGLQARRLGGMSRVQDIDYRWLKRVSDFWSDGLIFSFRSGELPEESWKDIDFSTDFSTAMPEELRHCAASSPEKVSRREWQRWFESKWMAEYSITPRLWDFDYEEWRVLV